MSENPIKSHLTHQTSISKLIWEENSIEWQARCKWEIVWLIIYWHNHNEHMASVYWLNVNSNEQKWERKCKQISHFSELRMCVTIFLSFSHSQISNAGKFSLFSLSRLFFLLLTHSFFTLNWCATKKNDLKWKSCEKNWRFHSQTQFALSHTLLHTEIAQSSE